MDTVIKVASWFVGDEARKTLDGARRLAASKSLGTKRVVLVREGASDGPVVARFVAGERVLPLRADEHCGCHGGHWTTTDDAKCEGAQPVRA